MSMRPGLILLLLLAVARGGDARDPLCEGVARIGVPGVPGLLSVCGPKAFAVVAAPAAGGAAPVVAASRAGKGRIVLFSHDGWFGPVLDEADTGLLMANAVRWAGGEKRKTRAGVRGLAHTARVLAARGLAVADLDGAGWLARLDDIDALCLAPRDLSDAEIEALEKFIAKGGGLLTGVTGWGWEQLNRGKSLSRDLPIHRLTAPHGLLFGGGSIHVPGNRLLEVTDPPPLAHAGEALDTLARGKAEPAAVATVSRCLRDLPPGDEVLLPRLRKLLRTTKRKLPPLTDADGLAKVLLAYELIDGDRGGAHPAAEQFPGAVARGAPAAEREVTVESTVGCWVSTGLYARPGEEVRAKVPPGAVGKGLSLRIGAHSDTLWDKPNWDRAPEITRAVALDKAEVKLANPFGGLVYVETGGGGSGGRWEIALSGCVEAPFYRLGETTPEEWAKRRKAPGPWAELATSKVILTVPSEFVRELPLPGPLLIFWDRVLDAAADLSSIPRERARPERYVTDKQISAGYMHSGYPIMTHLDAAPRFVDLKTLERDGDWGMFHEMGHNHQQGDWTFDGTVEVTCNLYSLYMLERVCTSGKIHEAIEPARRRELIARHRGQGNSFTAWKNQPFLALLSYAQLKEAFGWETYMKVFAEYRALAPAERPKNDDEKRDQWMTRFSRAVGRNLGPFFEAWGIPTSEAARRALADLPDWMPEEMR